MYHVGASLRLAPGPEVFYAVCDEWRSGVAGPKDSASRPRSDKSGVRGKDHTSLLQIHNLLDI